MSTNSTAALTFAATTSEMNGDVSCLLRGPRRRLLQSYADAIFADGSLLDDLSFLDVDAEYAAQDLRTAPIGAVSCL